MPSPFYGTDAVYGLRALLGTSNVDDIDAGFAALRDDIASKMKGAVPRVTVLPTVGPSGSGPLVNGQECYLVADAASGVLWHLRYNSGSGSAYKWEFLGGSPLELDNPAGLGDFTSASWGDPTLSAGPSITLPAGFSAGDFLVDVSAVLGIHGPTSGSVAGDFATSYVGLQIGGGTPSPQPGITAAITGDGQQSSAGAGGRFKKLAVATGAVLATKFFYSAAAHGTGGFGVASAASLSVRPVRVG